MSTTDTWTATSTNNWFTDAYWSNGAPPSAGGTAVIASDSGPEIAESIVAGITIDLAAAGAGGVADLLLVDATLGQPSAVVTVQATTAGAYGYLYTYGQDTIDGVFQSAVSGADLVLQMVDNASFGAPVLTSLGTIEATNGGLTYIEDAMSNDGTFVNDGLVLADGGGVAVGPDMTGSGDAEMANSGTLEVYTTAQNMVFEDSNPDALILYTPASYTGTVEGFSPGNTIEVRGETATRGIFDSGTLTLYDGSSTTAVGSILLSGSYAGDEFTVTPVEGGDSLITVANVPCYCLGTRIRTDRGPVAVERLAIGDLVETLHGGLRPIKWIGRRSYDGRFIAGRHLMLPVCIRQGAIEPDVPSRDLWVSPGHALYIDGVLIPAWRLVNGRSIVQAESVELVTYLHVELADHDVIFAEDCPAESFVEDSCRNQFQNAAEFDRLYPDDGDATRPLCAPRVEDGFQLQAIQQRLAERAGVRAGVALLGALHGFVDQAGPTLVEGWAQDLSAPEEPVCLDVLVDRVRVTRMLANRFRADLRRAGLGSGCHGFQIVLPWAHSGQLEIRRSVDGAALALTERAIAKAG